MRSAVTPGIPSTAETDSDIGLTGSETLVKAEERLTHISAAIPGISERTAERTGWVERIMIWTAINVIIMIPQIVIISHVSKNIPSVFL